MVKPKFVDIGKTRGVLEQGAKEGVYPGVVLLVSRDGTPLIHEAVGYLSLVPERINMSKDTIFDLSSLTKPLATTLAIMYLVDEGTIGLDQPLSTLLPETPLGEKRNLTLRLLLSHSAGLKDWQPYYLDLEKKEETQRKVVLRSRVIEEPFLYRPGSDSVYSDLGFIIIEWIIEEATGMSLSGLVTQYFYEPLSLERTFFNEGNKQSLPLKPEIAATEDCPWRKEILQGVVHDENAFAAGGVSGHAGLFSTAFEMFLIVNMLIEHYKGTRSDFFSPELVKEFFRRQDIVNGSSWALGWDTPSDDNSSSGRYFSPNSVGHLGFSGTSIWMDLDRDVIVILLTNRVHPTRSNNKIRAFRPILHDIVMEGF
jgi:CubicO group peptidase (beta-lactamase class C family)